MWLPILMLVGVAVPAADSAPGSEKLGRWHLLVRKSDFGTTPAPREDVRSYERMQDGTIRSVHRTTKTDGSVVVVVYTARSDGVEQPMFDEGGHIIGTIALRDHGPRKQSFVTKRDGRLSGRGTTTVSSDGATLRMAITTLGNGTVPHRVTTIFKRMKD